MEMQATMVDAQKRPTPITGITLLDVKLIHTALIAIAIETAQDGGFSDIEDRLNLLVKHVGEIRKHAETTAATVHVLPTGTRVPLRGDIA